MRQHTRSLHLLFVLPALGCATDPLPPFQMVELGQATSDSAGMDELDIFSPTGGAEYSCGDADDDSTVLVAPFDTITHDGLLYDSMLNRELQRTSKGRPALTCPRDDETPKPALCDVDGERRYSGLVDRDVRNKLCAEEWLSCISLLNSGVDVSEEGQRPKRKSILHPLFPSDIRFLKGNIPDACGCSDQPISEEEYQALQSWASNILIDAFDWELYSNTLYGTFHLVVENTAPTWTPAANSANANAGICGVWIFDQPGYDALLAPGEDGAPAPVEQYCGGVPLPSRATTYQSEPADDESGEEGTGEVADEGEESPRVGQPVPVTVHTVVTSEGLARVGGVGDLTNSSRLEPTDHPDRACPGRCKFEGGTEVCDVTSGRLVVTWSSDLVGSGSKRIQGDTLHLLVAECAPDGWTEDLNWQRACWHSTVSKGDMSAGKRVTASIEGITDSVRRDPGALDSR
jgi:hypothetical protein